VISNCGTGVICQLSVASC